MAEVMVVTFTCRSCGHQFPHESADFTLKFAEIHCPECGWCPLESNR